MPSGCRLIPVNRNIDEAPDGKVYPGLKAIRMEIDMMDIFRHPMCVLLLAEEAVAVGVSEFRLQDDVVNVEVVSIRRAVGFFVVMNHCIVLKHRHRFGASRN